MRPAVYANRREAAGGSRFGLDELSHDRAVSRVTLGGIEIQADMREEVHAIVPSCAKGPSIIEDSDASPVSVRPDTVVEAVRHPVDELPTDGVAAGRHG